MTVLRELVALFGVKYDPTGAKQAERGLENVKTKAVVAGKSVNKMESGVSKLGKGLGALGLAFGAAQAARGLFGLIGYASDANEVMNVLRATFDGAADDVVGWSEEAATRMGRSKYALQKSVSDIGSLIMPAFREMGAEGTKAAQDMSEGLSELVIDLASFKNLSEDDALTKVLAGLSGEAEPMRRVGVDLTVAGIADVMGIDGKSMAKMSRAEKFTIRYQAMLKQLSDAQGDAAKTSEEYANASRAMFDRLKEAGTELGKRFLPLATKAVIAIRDWASGIGEWIQTSSIFEGALVALGIGVIGLGIAFAGTLAPILLVMAGLVGIALVADDIITGFRGGKSMFGSFLDKMLETEGVLPKVATWFETFISTLRSAIDGAKHGWNDFFWNIQEGIANLLESAPRAFARIGESIKQALQNALPDWMEFLLGSSVEALPGGFMLRKGMDLATDGGTGDWVSEWVRPLMKTVGFGSGPGTFFDDPSKRYEPGASRDLGGGTYVDQPSGGMSMPMTVNFSVNGNMSRRDMDDVAHKVRRAADQGARELMSTVGGTP